MKGFFVALILGTHMISANAAIIDNGQYTTDNVTGLDWLDVTSSLDMSYNEVVSELGSGKLFDGWRYATADEFDTLVFHYGILPQIGSCPFEGNYCLSPGGSIDGIEGLITMLGDTIDAFMDPYDESDIDPDGAGYTSGYLLGPFDGPNQITNAIIFDGQYVYRSSGLPKEDHVDRIYTANLSNLKTQKDGYIGSFLVRTSVVPLPATAWLFASALGLLGWMRRKAA